jgi:hypothetical protein
VGCQKHVTLPGIRLRLPHKLQLLRERETESQSLPASFRLLFTFPRGPFLADVNMNDTMDIDAEAPRGVKRTAEEAGLPPEAPRRIKAR